MRINKFSELKSYFLDNTSTRQTILKNTFWLTIAELFSKALTYMVLVLMARHFDYTTFGKFSFALSFVTIFTVFSDIGFSTFVVNELSKDKSKIIQYIDNIIVIKAVLGVILLGSIFFTAQFINDQIVVQLIYLLAVYSILNAFGIFFYSIFQANEKMEYETIGRVCQQVSLLTLVLFFISRNGSIITMGYSYVVSVIVALAFYLFIIWNYFSKFFLKINLQYCWHIIKGTWAFGLVLIFNTLYHQIDMVMLALTKGYSAAGIYNVAQWLPLGLLIFPLILGGALFPKMSYFYKFSEDSLKKLYIKYFKCMSILGLAMGILVVLSADIFISLFFGAKYSASTIVLKIYIWSSVLVFIDSAFINLLCAIGKQSVVVKILGVTIILNFILNFIFINKYSYVGASIVAVISEAIVAISAFFVVSQTPYGFFVKNKKIS